MMEARVEEMKDLKEMARFESCETAFRYSSCVRQGSVEAPTLWMKLVTRILWNVK